MEPLDRLGRLGSDLILDGQGAEDPAVGDDVQDGPTVAAPGLGGRVGFEAHVGEEPRPTDGDRSTVHRRPSATTGERLEVGRRRRLDPARLGPGDDGPGERMLGVGLDRGGESQQLRLVRRRDRDERRLALRERAGLVEDDDLELAGPFERDAVLHEQAVAGAERGRDGDHQRDRQAQGVGAGDDEDGRGSDERALAIALDPPEHERDDAGEPRAT